MGLGTVRVLVAGLALLASASTPSAASAKDVNRPLILVHGHEADSGVNCNGTWKDLMRHYRWFGYKGPFHPVRYYRDDTTCTAFYGAGSSPRISSATSDDKIEDVARAFAWYVYNSFNRHGKAVNVLAHSMGGLVVRYAIDQVQRKKPGWPPAIVIPSVLTFGTPHNGIELGPFFAGCRATGDSGQCRQMDKSASFIEYLRKNARSPQGAYGTWWSLAGSHADKTVDEASAIDMSVKYKLRWASEVDIEHSEYMHERAGGDFTPDAHCWATATGVAFASMKEGQCYWPLQWSYVILSQYGY
jgi:pimeloyl-ACP methyl ester carboxylesterase